MTLSTRITGFSLKVLAILGMTANHVAHVFIDVMPWQATAALYSLGGLTFPIMAFLVVEGYRHTSSLPRYAGRMAVFAAVSQVPFWLCFGWPTFDWATGGLNLNVFFTLLIGLGVLWAHDNVRTGAVRALVIASGFALSWTCDWGVVGPLMVLMFCVLRDDGVRGIVATMALPFVVMLIPSAYLLTTGTGTLLERCDAGYALVGFTLAAIVICRYNGQRGFPLKWAFYAYYPLHLLVIWAVHQAVLCL